AVIVLPIVAKLRKYVDVSSWAGGRK
ncbi:MAG: hypothetical protein K0R55_4242, partial [Sporomusa sp.]|nr:hypothetical protein [Sporomusa sp.]